MFVKGDELELKDLGGGVSRKVLAYDENLMSVDMGGEFDPVRRDLPQFGKAEYLEPTAVGQQCMANMQSPQHLLM